MKIFSWLASGSCQADQGVPQLPAKQPPCACCKPTANFQAAPKPNFCIGSQGFIPKGAADEATP